MVIQCSHCQARFKLADEKIKAEGTKVRCAKCREVFTVFPPAAEPAAPVVAAVAPPAPVTPPEPPPAVPAPEPDEFSFDISDITAPPPVPSPEPPQPAPVIAAPPVAPVPEPVGETTAAGTTGIEFSFEETPVPTPTLAGNTAVFTFESASAADSDALSFDDSVDTLPSLSFESSAAPSAQTDSLSFDLPEPTSAPLSFELESTSFATEAEPTTLATDAASAFDTLGFDTTTEQQPAPEPESFSFDNAPASDFDTFGFDEQPTQPPLPDPGDFSFDQAGSGDFSWDEEPTPAAVAAPAGDQRPPAASDDFDFSSLSFDEPAAPAPAASSSQPEPAAIGVNPFATGPVPASTGSPVPTPPAAQSIALASSEAAPSTPVASAGKRESARPARTPARPTRTAARRSSSFSVASLLKIILLLVVLGAAGTGAYFWKIKGYSFEEIVNRFIERQTPVDASGQITIANLSGSYVSNKHEGNLFVIRGDAFNEYKASRSTISVKGTLYGQQGKVLAEQVAFCGNIPNDETLQKAEFEELAAIMQNEFGDSFTNVNVAAGKAVPFTIIFKKVPKGLTEFNVEVVNSVPGSK